MALTRLKNIITSRTGRIIYVNPDDFDASDAYDNRGNSALRPFKTLQRAFLEVARFSYRVGLSNDEFDAFSIYLYPSDYVIDNRPGVADYNDIQPFDSNTNFDLTSSSNVLYKFNAAAGGIIAPRGVSLLLVLTFVEPKSFQNTSLIPRFRVLSVLLLLTSLLLLRFLNSQVDAISGSNPFLMETIMESITVLTT